MALLHLTKNAWNCTKSILPVSLSSSVSRGESPTELNNVLSKFAVAMLSTALKKKSLRTAPFFIIISSCWCFSTSRWNQTIAHPGVRSHKNAAGKAGNCVMEDKTFALDTVKIGSALSHICVKVDCAMIFGL